MDSLFDTRMMARALQLARRGRFWAAPNPHVGCVLTRSGTVIGEGFTRPAGGNHAEVEALLAAGDARGATAYITLEPCSHHGRTGPCAEALAEAGVERVVVAMADPNPRVSGGGLARLRAAGIAVETGLLAAEAEAEIAGFVARMRRGRGRVRAKLAASLDGRTAMASGESQWITGPAARRDGQRLRAASCAIVTGVGTVLADDCALTVRAGELGLSAAEIDRATHRAPLRVVLDSRGRTPATARILDGSSPTLLCRQRAAGPDERGAEAAPAALAPTAPALPVEHALLPGDANGLDLAAVFDELTARECNEILVESGPHLTGAMLRGGWLDELIIYMAPTLLGSMAQPLVDLPLGQMAEQVRLQCTDSRRVGDDWRLTFTVRGGQ